MRKGIIGPFDPAPPPVLQADFYDYRGLARPRDIAHGSPEFALGRYRMPKGRWQLGRNLGLSFADVNKHACVVAPTRAGKTASVIAPWIYAAAGHGLRVVAVDVKGNGDLLNEVKTFSAAHGPLGVPVISWDYTAPRRSVSWNWISDLRSDGEINAAAEAIVGRPNPNSQHEFFQQRARKYLRGLLELAGTLPTNSTVADLLTVLSDQTLLSALVNARSNTAGARRLVDLVGVSPADYGKLTGELLTHLETLDTAGFRAVTERAEFSLDFADNAVGHVIIVTAPERDGALAAAASGLFFGQLLYRVMSSFGSGVPTLFVIDEAPVLQDRIDLKRVLTLVAGANVGVLLTAQDVSMFHAEDRETILANCATVVCMAGVGPETTQWMGSRLGDHQVLSLSKSTGTSYGAGTSQTLNRTYDQRPVLSHREISTPPFPGRPAIVHARSISHRPILVDLTRADLER